jgi:hypothetical protein
MTAPNSLSKEVRQIRDGHLLRWIKQMALRGRSREFDDTGACGAQKLVVTGDLKLLMANLHRVFPGAKLSSNEDSKATNLERLLRYLSTAGLPSRVSTKQISDHFQRPWRSITGDITRDFDALLCNAGWRYVSKRGPTGAYFERIESGLRTQEDLRAYRRRLIELIRRHLMASGKFISYLRVSTDKQGRSGLGLEAQRATVDSYLNGGRWKLLAEYVETESGRRTDRPQLTKALAHAKAVGATLVFAKLDRLTRNVDLLRSLVASNVDLVFCDLPHVPAGTMGRFLLTQMACGR